ncbi:MAG: tRNA (N6-threonylcarbamoyladenosine(37)-N6)-methyltransferase TrmO [Ruminococcaceae bacterium]|nr:tRNA (N6-threonylcarbamoyladenosine(37)-N6)-methyltransferase TrmO [Oscillospiraceae bacterium]
MEFSDNIKIIARINTDFHEKFAIPRQSGLSSSIGKIVFEKEYRCDEALRGIEGFSHLWLIWKFSKSEREKWSPTVRPPRLGGNKRMGVFATRSPFRPNPIGLSSVELVGLEKTEEGTVLIVRGADLLDGTPIYDIKPYLAFTDSHPQALGGFSDEKLTYSLKLDFSDEFQKKVSPQKLDVLKEILSQDPRPSYIEDETRVYGFSYADYEIRFSVCGDTLKVLGIENV